MRGTRAVILAAGMGTRMKSDLPKVVHEVGGKPMIVHCVERASAAGADEVIVIVGYRQELVRQALEGHPVSFAVQEERLGTGHAVLQARRWLEGFDGNALVLYGDMPLLRETTIRALVERREETDAAGVLLTLRLEDRPDFGRVVRDEQGRIQRIVEVKDATPAELAVGEVNVGAYCFDVAALLGALGRLRSDNRQGEYYLTDVIGILAGDGRRVEGVTTTDVDETLGINDPAQLAAAEERFAGG